MAVLFEFSLSQFTFSDVENEIETTRLSLKINTFAGNQKIPNLFVGHAKTDFEVSQRTVTDERFDEQLTVVNIDAETQLNRGIADNLISLQTGYREKHIVNLKIFTIGHGDNRNRFRARFKSHAKLLLTLPQRRLGQFAFRNVVVDRLIATIRHFLGMHFDGKFCAIRTQQIAFLNDNIPLVKPPKTKRIIFKFFGIKECPDRQADKLIQRPASQFLH